MDADKFRSDILEPTLLEFQASPDSIRLATLTAWAIDSFASHIYEQLKASGRIVPKTDGQFKKDVLKPASSDFTLVWEYSIAMKHGTAARSKIIKSSSETLSVKVEGWLAYFSGTPSDEWGEYAVVNNADLFCRRVVPAAVQATSFLDDYFARNR